jgi:signal peptidase I
MDGVLRGENAFCFIFTFVNTAFRCTLKRAPAFVNTVNNFMETTLNMGSFIFYNNIAVRFSVNKTLEINFKFMLGRFLTRASSAVKKVP